MTQHDSGMTKIEATASIFVTAFRSLTKTERRAVAEHLLTDESLARDILGYRAYQSQTKRTISDAR